MDEKSLRTRFEYILDCFEKGDGEAYMATLDPGYTMFDEDIPFRLDKAAYQRHFELIAQHLENIQFIARDTRFAVHGQAGVIDGYYDFRNKPKDSGYRIRFGRHTMTLAWKDGNWMVIAWHLSTILGATEKASPS